MSIERKNEIKVSRKERETDLAFDGGVGERFDGDAGGARGTRGELELLDYLDGKFSRTTARCRPRGAGRRRRRRCALNLSRWRSTTVRG